MKNIFLLSLLCMVLSCQTENVEQTFSLENIPSSTTQSGEPNLFVSQHNIAYFTWIEQVDDSTDVLQFSKLENQHWSSPQTIASGRNWFVNWADFPSLVSSADGKTLAAHWLQKSTEGTYDYDIHIALSADQGHHWSSSFIPHRDSIAAEHGFVTMLPMYDDQIFASWLDGRNTKVAGSSSDDHGHGHHGAMSLRAAVFDQTGVLSAEVELDHKICDCCQTDAAMTSNGPIVVYRDRSEEEIRDISIVRKVDTDWTQPRNISKDGWKITGCPVNGPAVAAEKQRVAMTWFSAAKEQPVVQLILSEDAGASFFEPIRLDEGQALGRVDVVLVNDRVYVSWLEQVEDLGKIMLAEVDWESRKILRKEVLVETSVSRSSGFPVLEVVHGRLLLAWTIVEEVSTRVALAWVD